MVTRAVRTCLPHASATAWSHTGFFVPPPHRHKPIDDKPVLAFQYIHMGRNGECDTLDRRTRHTCAARVSDG